VSSNLKRTLLNLARRMKDFIWTKVQEKDRVHLREWIRCDGLAFRHRQFQVEQQVAALTIHRLLPQHVFASQTGN
jgi:hypothetical protein